MNILIVDDDQLIREMTSQILSVDGNEVMLASGGEEALSILDDKQYDLMICDIVMPDKEGIEVISRAKGLNQQMKIIAISGGGSLEDFDFLDLAGKMGADTTLEKPFSPDQLLEKVKSLTI